MNRRKTLCEKLIIAFCFLSGLTGEAAASQSNFVKFCGVNISVQCDMSPSNTFGGMKRRNRNKSKQRKISQLYLYFQSSPFSSSLYSMSAYFRVLHSVSPKYCVMLTSTTAFRMTSVFPPVPHPLANKESSRIKLEKHTATCLQPLDVMIQARKVYLYL